MPEIDPLLEIIEKHLTNKDGSSKLTWCNRYALWLDVKKYMEDQKALAATHVLLDLEQDDNGPDGV